MAVALAGLVPGLATWFLQVQRIVPQPYLDEVFHIRQAQHYCAGRYDIWDPKITTPPGLYLLSHALSPILGCNIPALRLSCAIWLASLLGLVYYIVSQRTRHLSHSTTSHIALNVALFPVLFFFGALYYTDVASTLSVILFYVVFIHVHRTEHSPWHGAPLLVALGLFSLLFRQTNIFWVAVLPAGLVLINAVDTAPPVVKDSMRRRASGFGDSWQSVAKTSWKMGAVYDPPIGEAWLEDYARTVMSIVICLIRTVLHPHRFSTLIIMALAPYMTLIVAFGGFVAWNGGVVLGDKSNHVATLHLAQMLYLWPYMVFFSWPLALPYLLLHPLYGLSRLISKLSMEPFIFFRRVNLRPRIWPLLTAVLLASVVIATNTIVHPFTLADNRHYTFYVFRLLLRPWWVRFAVAPVYVWCAWACIQALGAEPPLPVVDHHQKAEPRPVSSSSSSSSSASSSSSSSSSSSRALALPDGAHAATVSFVLVWLATTTLSLVTAPLVEPRYFILPWLFWRLHLPHTGGGIAASSLSRPLTQNGERRRDYRLWLETSWLLLVNALTGYIFLHRGFAWPQEPGRVQRFMW